MTTIKSVRSEILGLYFGTLIYCTFIQGKKVSIMVRFLLSLFTISCFVYQDALSQINVPEQSDKIEISLKEQSKILLFLHPLDKSMADFSNYIPNKSLTFRPIGFHASGSGDILNWQSKASDVIRYNKAKPPSPVRISMSPLDNSLIPSIEKAPEKINSN